MRLPNYKSAVCGAAVSILLLGLLGRCWAESRTWKDSTGKFEVVAELVGVQDSKVSLKKEDGTVISVDISQLSSADRQYLANLSQQPASSADEVSVSQLTGKPSELANDDGKPAGKKSFPRGIASLFKVADGEQYLTSIKIHGARYGSSRAPKEDFMVTLCDPEFKTIKEFKFPYSRFSRGTSKWVTLRVKPTKLPKEFVICLNFQPTSTKGVFVSHDAEGKSLVGLPEKPSGSFTGGDWMVRAVADKLK